MPVVVGYQFDGREGGAANVSTPVLVIEPSVLKETREFDSEPTATYSTSPAGSGVTSDMLLFPTNVDKLNPAVATPPRGVLVAQLNGVAHPNSVATDLPPAAGAIVIGSAPTVIAVLPVQQCADPAPAQVRSVQQELQGSLIG